MRSQKMNPKDNRNQAKSKYKRKHIETNSKHENIYTPSPNAIQKFLERHMKIRQIPKIVSKQIIPKVEFEIRKIHSNKQENQANAKEELNIKTQENLAKIR